MFPVRYELNSYILFKRNSVFKGFRHLRLLQDEISEEEQDAETQGERIATELFAVAIRFLQSQHLAVLQILHLVSSEDA
jgi:hypothetical protein